MADANTGTGDDLGTSNKPPYPQASEPEARIIEETVIRHAPLHPPLGEGLLKIPAPHSAIIVPPIPSPAKAPEPPHTPDLSKGTLVATNGHVVQGHAPVGGSSLGAPETAGKEQEAITRILKEIKLPERREPPTTTSRSTIEMPKTFDTVLGGTALPEKKAPEVPASAAATQTVPENGEKAVPSVVSPLRTLKNDLQEIVRTKKMSLVRAVALEQEKMQGQSGALRADHAEERRGRAFHVLFAVVLLFMLGGAALFGVYVITQDRGSTPVREDTSLLFAEAAVSIPLENQSSSDLKRLLSQGRMGGSGTLGSITRIVPTVPAASETTSDASAPIIRPATTEEFLSALGTRASPDLLRALGNDFFFGFHTVDKNAPLLVIPVISYERTFAGMLAWETTISADLAPVFMPIPNQKIGSSGLPEKRTFEDLVMRNYDVRALKDDAGNIGLYYSFPTQNILLIAESPYSFAEVLSRLRAGRKL